MKKIYILSVLLLLSSIGVFAQDEVINIPDANFKKALLNHDPVIDTNGDGEIQKSETEAFTGGLELNNKLISNLKGIEYFINVTKLNVSGNLFSKIDVSKNIKLTWLNCKECSGITQFDVSNNTALKILEFGGYYCFVKNIDLTNNTELTELNCSSNELTELDLTKNTELTKLSCNSNRANAYKTISIKSI
jgi:Leucine-rich repeat (LRR) protein